MRILLIEDSAPTRELLEHSLAAAGHTLFTAARVSSALKLATEETFDVLVIDIQLPDGSGLDLCRDLRSRGLTTPILFLTARGEVGDRIEGLDAGADDYLRKPFALAELHARLRALGRRSGLAAPARIEWPGTTIDFGARRLSRDGADVPLTAREWTVLELRAARAGRVVPREEVLELGWGEAGHAASESLDVIMSRLRRKLADPARAECVRTVRGVGYVFERPPA
jgi:two-component system response regulator MprA